MKQITIDDVRPAPCDVSPSRMRNNLRAALNTRAYICTCFLRF